MATPPGIGFWLATPVVVVVAVVWTILSDPASLPLRSIEGATPAGHRRRRPYRPLDEKKVRRAGVHREVGLLGRVAEGLALVACRVGALIGQMNHAGPIVARVDHVLAEIE